MEKNTVSEPSNEPHENGTNNRSDEERAADLAYWHDNLRDYWIDLSAVARKLTKGNIGRAERILQDVCVKFEKHPPRRGKVDEPKAYLVKALKNANADASPKHQHDSLDDPDAHVPVRHLSIDPKVHENLENKQLLDFFAEGMAPFDQEVYELWRQGYSTREIADKLGKSIEAVHTAKRRILYQARRKLDQLEPPADLTEPKVPPSSHAARHE